MKNIYDLLNDVQEKSEDTGNPVLNRSERAKMKREFRRAAGLNKKSTVRWTTAAACLVCLVGFSQTAFAKTAIDGILQTISLGHNTVLVEDPNAAPSKPEVYDKDGNPITSMPGGKDIDIYDKNGKKLGTIANGDHSDNRVTEKELSKAVAQLTFQPLLPASMPSGYAFDCAKLYPDDNGKIDGDYADFYFTNGDKKIFVQERRNTSEAATETGGTDVKVLNINGHKAALIDGDTLEWETDKVSVYIAAQKNLSEQELISFAKSFQVSK
ncbi:DUF4367 domain-containing protein [Caproiciproducens sp. NJN-50]|uniref:DUF4367 domain-containing protein n=1 Tax=Acutalibacteraceae TaxID=3082771 RepID=UPI000FFE3149|nr:MULTISPECIES: DUF4367 domain-containing protein [Acutalibacteraceae]QAT49225.1 DUF4367 domain-containing protein [Caproiciproducens sp. NJN-50]